MSETQVLTLATKQPERYRIYKLGDRLSAFEDVITHSLWLPLARDYWGRVH